MSEPPVVDPAVDAPSNLLARMENAGIAVDVPGLQALSDEFGADMRQWHRSVAGDADCAGACHGAGGRRAGGVMTD